MKPSSFAQWIKTSVGKFVLAMVVLVFLMFTALAGFTISLGLAATPANIGMILNASLAGSAGLAETRSTLVATAPLNVRAGPGYDYAVLGALTLGQTVKLIDRTADGSWTQVAVSNKLEGWAYSAYLQPVISNGSYVLIEGLNLRSGPGLNYKVIQLLEQGQSVTLTGRNTYGDWLTLKLKNGTAGWVFAPFIYTDEDIFSLPVSEAYGGPVDSGPTPNSGTGMNLVVTIRDNQASVDVRNFPGSTSITAYLGLPGGGTSLAVASGTTLADGSARLVFTMPSKWGDGSKLTQENLILVVKTADGSFSRTASIIYLRY